MEKVRVCRWRRLIHEREGKISLRPRIYLSDHAYERVRELARHFEKDDGGNGVGTSNPIGAAMSLILENAVDHPEIWASGITPYQHRQPSTNGHAPQTELEDHRGGWDPRRDEALWDAVERLGNGAK